VKALQELGEKRGWRILVLALHDDGRSAAGTAFESPALRYLPARGGRWRFAGRAALEALRADLVIFGHVSCCILAWAAIRARTCVIAHGIEVWRRLALRERAGLLAVDKILAVSAFTRDAMARENRLDAARFAVLHNALDPASEGEILSRERLELPAGKMLLTVSRLGACELQKGVEAALRAMPAVMARVPGAFYVVVGEGGDRPRLQALAEELAIASRTFFVGRVSDQRIQAYYRQCDLFVLPSRKEGFGIVFLEAMRFAKPCVGARAGGIPEVIEDGRTGILADPEDPRSLETALLRLLEDEALRARMGAAAKARWEREFSFEKYKNKLLEALWP